MNATNLNYDTYVTEAHEAYTWKDQPAEVAGLVSLYCLRHSADLTTWVNGDDRHTLRAYLLPDTAKQLNKLITTLTEELDAL